MSCYLLHNVSSAETPAVCERQIVYQNVKIGINSNSYKNIETGLTDVLFWKSRDNESRSDTVIVYSDSVP